MENLPPNTPTSITRIEVDPSTEFSVDSKCEMPTQTRWQMALIAAGAIALASCVLLGMSYLAVWLAS